MSDDLSAVFENLPESVRAEIEQAGVEGMRAKVEEIRARAIPAEPDTERAARIGQLEQDLQTALTEPDKGVGYYADRAKKRREGIADIEAKLAAARGEHDSPTLTAVEAEAEVRVSDALQKYQALSRKNFKTPEDRVELRKLKIAYEKAFAEWERI